MLEKLNLLIMLVESKGVYSHLLSTVFVKVKWMSTLLIFFLDSTLQMKKLVQPNKYKIEVSMIFIRKMLLKILNSSKIIRLFK